jgi:hypothetical protein
LANVQIVPPERFDIPLLRERIQPDIINPGQKIALVTLYTPNIQNYARRAEANQEHYAKKWGYTLIVYRDSVLDWDQANGAWHSIVTWNKIRFVCQ